MRKILVVKNAAEEGLGVIADELKLAEIEWDTIEPYARQTIPTGEAIDEAGYKGLIVLGGPMSANHDIAFPFLLDEIQLIRDMLERKLPMLNVCLGAQLLARACGVSLAYGGVKEVGWHSVHLNEWYTKRNPLFFQLPLEFMTFHWHQDTFDIPTEGYRLAGSELYPNQAFCVQGNAVGIQFHPELTKDMIEGWIEKDRQRSHPFLDAAQEDMILNHIDEYLPAQRDIVHKLIYGFATLMRPDDYRRPAVEEKPEAEAASEVTSETEPSATTGEDTSTEKIA